MLTCACRDHIGTKRSYSSQSKKTTRRAARVSFFGPFACSTTDSVTTGMKSLLLTDGLVFLRSVHEIRGCFCGLDCGVRSAGLRLDRQPEFFLRERGLA